jgi:hypothetical protein
VTVPGLEDHRYLKVRLNASWCSFLFCYTFWGDFRSTRSGQRVLFGVWLGGLLWEKSGIPRRFGRDTQCADMDFQDTLIRFGALSALT